MPRAALKTSQQSIPLQGNRELPITLDFTAGGIITDDFQPEMQSSQIDIIQSVYIDNADNAASLVLTFLSAGLSQRVVAQPFTQGIYPIVASGAVRLQAQTDPGIKIPIILSNERKPYQVWGPVPGVTVTPPLVNPAFAPLALGIGNTVLLAGVVNKQIKLYRGIFNVDAPTILLWTDGAGGTVLFSATLTAGGAIFFQPSGIAWFNTSVGNDLVLNSSAAVNLYGGWGYVQA